MHLGLIGYGSIARSLLELLAKSRVTMLTVLVRPSPEAKRKIDSPIEAEGFAVRFVTSVSELSKAKPDLVVECAGHSAVADHVPALLKNGIDVVVTSTGALANEQLHAQIDAAAAQGASKILLPSGAIGGLDILMAISQQCEVALTYRGTKPAAAWEGSLAEDVLHLPSLKMAETFFSGTGRQAALAFPRNANVVATLALAGGGFDKMKVELVADPHAQSNQHTYEVVSPLCRFSMAIEATPSPGNARTSITTALSIVREIADYQIVRRSNSH